MSITVGSPYEAGRGAANSAQANISASRLQFLVALAYVEMAESGLADKVDEQQKQLNRVEDYRKVLQVLQTETPSGDDTKYFGDVILKDGTKVSVHKFFQANGIPIDVGGNDELGNKAEFEAAIANIKAAIDTMNSQSQITLLGIQADMGTLERGLSLTSNTLNKDHEGAKGIVANIR